MFFFLRAGYKKREDWYCSSHSHIYLKGDVQQAALCVLCAWGAFPVTQSHLVLFFLSPTLGAV